MSQTDTYHIRKFELMDLCRGLAAYLVAFVHFSPYGIVKVSDAAGALCVGFFFMLSGFVLNHAYGDAIRSQSMTFVAFIKVRVARLYPLHILTFVLVLLYWFGLDMLTRMNFPLNVHFPWSWTQALENLSFTHMIFSQSVSFNTPAWSIGVEFWAGMLVFILSRLSPVGRRSVISALSALYGVVLLNGGMLLADPSRVYDILDKNYFTAFFLFSVGYLLREKSDVLSPKNLNLWFLIGFIVLVFISLVFADYELLKQYPQAELAYFLMFAVFILCLSKQGPLPVFLSKLSRFFGQTSYGIYLWHVPLLLLLTAVSSVLEKTVGISLIGGIGITIVYALVLPVLAYVSYHWYERASQKFIRDL